MAVSGVVGVGVSSLYSSSVETVLAQLRRREQEIVRAIKAMSGSASGRGAASATGLDTQRAQLEAQLAEVHAQITRLESRQGEARRSGGGSAGSGSGGDASHALHGRGSLDVQA